jgi:hypothetical protein
MALHGFRLKSSGHKHFHNNTIWIQVLFSLGVFKRQGALVAQACTLAVIWMTAEPVVAVGVASLLSR